MAAALDHEGWPRWWAPLPATIRFWSSVQDPRRRRSGSPAEDVSGVMTNTVQTAVVGVTGTPGPSWPGCCWRHPRLQGTPPVLPGAWTPRRGTRWCASRRNSSSIGRSSAGGFPGMPPPTSSRAFLVGAPWQPRRRGSVSRHSARAVARVGARGACARSAGHRSGGAWRSPSQQIAPCMDSRMKVPIWLRRRRPKPSMACPNCIARGSQVRGSSPTRLLRNFHHPGAAAAGGRRTHRSGPRHCRDAKSGVSGAGKAPTAKTHFMSAADNLSAYAVFTQSPHRRTA